MEMRHDKGLSNEIYPVENPSHQRLLLFTALWQYLKKKDKEFWAVSLICNIVEVANQVKKKYKTLFRKHEIHTVDDNYSIVMTDADINEFAVKLTINRDRVPEDTFKNEKRRYFDNLRHIKSERIDIAKLISNDNESRVTFIRGIAGMGKSVLAKQIAFGWASDDMYQQFKLCIMIECRQLNYFNATEGDSIKQHKVFDEFLHEKFNYNFGDGEGILFVIDGVDELFDINMKESAITQLLDLSHQNYISSRIIITGRPHVEDKLKRHGNDMGGLQKFEIQGLSDNQIGEYISKFSLLKENVTNINKAKESSKWSLPIIYIPQFLNTFCCVAILMKGKGISDSTELYCWTIYLLLRQHDAKKSGACNLEFVSDIFKEYSQSLLTLSEICYDLLIQNNIIFKGRIESLIPETSTGQKFIKGLFFKVSSNFEERYQFKHLSIMEFLAALYICGKIRGYKKIVKKSLKQGLIEVVSFVCCLIAGWSSTGIRSTILSNVIDFQPIDDNLFLKNVINIIVESPTDKRTVFKSSVQIIAYFLSEKLSSKKVLIPLLEQIEYCGYSDLMDSNNIMLICNHLIEVCSCSDDDVRMAFKNILLFTYEVKWLEHLRFVKYAATVERILLCDINKDWKSVYLKLNEEAVGKCKKLYIEDCQFQDEEELVEVGTKTSDEKFPVLAIARCNLSMASFQSICELGMLSGMFSFSNMDIKSEWWEEFVKIMKRSLANDDLKLATMTLTECTANLTEEVKNEILQARITLQIDGKTLELTIHYSYEQQIPALVQEYSLITKGNGKEAIARSGKSVINCYFETLAYLGLKAMQVTKDDAMLYEIYSLHLAHLSSLQSTFKCLYPKIGKRIQ